MDLTRRDFLKLSAGSLGAMFAASSVANLVSADDTYYTGEKITPDSWKKGVCRLCGTGCGVDVGIKDGKMVAIKGNKSYPVNKGMLCLKGASLQHIVYSKERATKPYIRNGDVFMETTMDAALDHVAGKIKNTIEEHGPDSVALYVGAQVFTEEMFVGNKLFKGLIGTNNVEANARLCMASAVTGFLTTFGLDEPSGGYDDIEHADCFFVIGANLAEQHPIIFGRLLMRKANNPNFKLIVADPRFTPTAAHADIWLPHFPGTDIALMNALCHVLVKEGMINRDFIEAHTIFAEGGAVWGEQKELSFDSFVAFLDDYAPEKVAKQVGVDAEKIREAARMFGSAKGSMSLWTMGLNQQKWGTWANNAVYNMHLLTGKMCTPGNTALSMTGQPNACGGVREQGMLAHLLPAHRLVAKETHRAEMEKLWNIPQGSISPTPGPHTMKMFDMLGDKIKLIWIVCSNPAQSLPNLNKYFPKLKDAFVIVQDIIPPPQVQPEGFPNVTAGFADIFIPSAFWNEKGGVFGNTERRSGITEKMIEPPPGIMSDGEIFIEVAKRMGFREHFEYPTTESIWREYQKCTAGTDLDLSGATYEYFRKHDSTQWPMPAGESKGTDRRYIYPNDKHLKHLVAAGEVTLPSDNIYFYGKPNGKAVIFKRPQMSPEEVPDNEYPFYFTTGRVVHHWHTGTMTMQVPWLKKMVKDAFIEINIEDAEKKGIRNGDMVRVSSRRGSVELRASVVDTRGATLGVGDRISIPRPGVIFAPFFDAAKLVNLVCSDAVDGMSKEPEYKICAARIEKV